MKGLQRQWQWEKESVLNRIGLYTPTKDIFDATCKEVGRYYSGKEGFKTYKRKIKWTGTYINCQMIINTAHWNTSGKSVCFDIHAVLYANDKTGMDEKGILGSLSYVTEGSEYKFRKVFNVYKIDQDMFFEIVDYIDEMVKYVKLFDHSGYKQEIQ